MRFGSIFSVVSFLIGALGSSITVADDSRSRAVIQVANSSGTVSDLLHLDLDCDGKNDTAWITTTQEAVTVHVTFGDPKRPPATLEIPVGGGDQGSLCSLPVHLELASMDFDANDPKEGIGNLLGYRRSKTCKALDVVDDSRDSFHLYWDHDGHLIRWWRQ